MKLLHHQRMMRNKKIKTNKQKYSNRFFISVKFKTNHIANI